MTAAERQRRSRSMRALRAAELHQAEDEALTEAFLGSYGEREANIRLADVILAAERRE